MLFALVLSLAFRAQSYKENIYAIDKSRRMMTCSIHALKRQFLKKLLTRDPITQGNNYN